jgi:kynureninase
LKNAVDMNDAIAALGPGPLTEAALARHVFPLFSHVLDTDRVYLENHSLGRPLDQTADDVQEACALWQSKLGDAWDAWLAERECSRARFARLIGAPRTDCVVPKTSAGQGLRTVLNAMPGKPRVISTAGEFDSIDLILRQYAACGRIQITWVEPEVSAVIAALDAGADLVVVSQVLYMTSRILRGFDRLAPACHAAGARLLVDAYHAIGVFPVDVTAMGADFLIGASYKYLRGGPGAGFLYISPSVLDSGFVPLDTGWFAKDDPFAFERPDPPRFAAGGDAFLESTPPIFTYYQARAGQQFTLEIGVARLRAYSLEQLARFKAYLADAGVSAEGGDADYGAFLTIRVPDARDVVRRLAERGVDADARGQLVRVCPDCLTTDAEMQRAALSIRLARAAP